MRETLEIWRPSRVRCEALLLEVNAYYLVATDPFGNWYAVQCESSGLVCVVSSRMCIGSHV